MHHGPQARFAPRFVRDAGVVLLRVLVLGALVLLALGPALGPFLREIGAAPVHACACGMKPGTCGCPECDRLLHEDDGARAPSTVAVLGACDDHGQAPLPTPLPLGLLPAALVAPASPPAGRLVSVPRSTWVPSEGDGPATPPPRFATV